MGKTYSLVLSKKARSGLAQVHPSDRARIEAALELLRHNPYVANATKLSGTELFRVRVSNYRIVYAVYKSKLVIEVINIGHRRDIYRNL